MTERRRRLVPELDERDLEGVPMIALAAVLALFDQVEALRPLLPEELSTRYVVEQVREGRNQLLEERFGRGMARSERWEDPPVTARRPAPGPPPEQRSHP